MNRYLLVYRNDSITEFNERFINYGFNKISYVETLRREEYRFVLAGNVFAFDLPHLPYENESGYNVVHLFRRVMQVIRNQETI